MPKEYIVHFREALYKTVCPTCKDTVRWDNAGGIHEYHAKCCDNRFYMSPHDVLVEITLDS